MTKPATAPIPEDLKDEYRRVCNVRNSLMMIANVDWLRGLIERIAQLKAANAELVASEIALRTLLMKLDRKGGLGLDVHALIQVTLEETDPEQRRKQTKTKTKE